MTPARTCVFHPRFRIVRKALFSSGYSPPRFKARFPFTAGLFLAQKPIDLLVLKLQGATNYDAF